MKTAKEIMIDDLKKEVSDLKVELGVAQIQKQTLVNKLLNAQTRVRDLEAEVERLDHYRQAFFDLSKRDAVRPVELEGAE